LWEEFHHQYIGASRDNQPQIDICDFLSCILDSKFCHLEVDSKLNELEDPSREGKFYPVHVIETIAHNSPILPSLSFNFCSGSLIQAGHLKKCFQNLSLI
jgi:hypothetical protein